MRSDRRCSMAALAVLATMTALIFARPVSAADESKDDEAKPVSAGYDKGFFVRDTGGLFEMKVNMKLQPGFAFSSEEDHVVEVDPDSGDELVLSRTDRTEGYFLQIRRAELKFSGHALRPNVRYAAMVDFGRGSPALRDLFLDFGLAPGKLHLRVGQWKRPFSRQHLVGSGNLELVDRAITDKAFGAGRDIGIALHNDYEKSPPFEWALGVFNGTGDRPWFAPKLSVDDATGAVTDVGSGSGFTNVPDRLNPMVVARVGYNHGKLKGYSEADLEGGPFRLGVGLAGVLDFASTDADVSSVRGEFDLVMKVRGFSTLAEVFVMSAQDGESFADQAYNSVGVLAQAGMVLSNLIQPVVRYALVSLDGDLNDTQEITGGLNVYVIKHNLKWQTDFGGRIYEHDMGDLTDYLLRSQITLAF